MGFGMMGACCCDSGFVLLVATHGRYDTGGGVYSTVTAWDGTGSVASTPPASPLWTYDLGQTSAGNNWIPGHPKIDADGNVYVPYMGKTSGGGPPNDYRCGLVKLDISGALQWDYLAGVRNFTPFIALRFREIPRCQFTSGGNIIFSHYTTTSGGHFMTVLDPSGSVVLQITQPSSATVGVTVFAGQEAPANVLDLDSADNIYFNINYTSGNLGKLDSSGTYVSRVALATGGSNIPQIVIDRATDKIMSTSVGYITTSGKAIQQVDAATLAEDWSLTLAQMDAQALSGAGQSTNECYTPALSPDGSKLYTAARLVKAGPTQLSNFQDVTANVLSGSQTVNFAYNAVSNDWLNGMTCDPVTGDLFAYINDQNIDRVYKLVSPVPGGGTDPRIWWMFNPTGTGLADGVMGLDARSVPA